ncbi:MAG TPA: elongation factor P [Cryomorphaceae bacterium]|nr:elongation factor P [Owenweeksia sp.]MBG00076.1 elongation factor P [Owenweeksia sp.]HAD96246.1 elongation factor P [Cryomorphaceae bacterium]HBF21813.1 elongation factor P [Cryomorphaceae bacterium]HCQ14744.1 elongation factor P [Cryomorphaceae bacterium]|tara:strand:- start:166 stop:732 length:567 start_codon:yes stop_codon:yes gene_type:complete
MASTSDIRNGLCINFNGAPYQIIEFLHVKPGKGPAFVRTKLRNLDNGRVLENTFPSGAKIEEIRVENRTYQFLYQDPSGYHFMNMDDYNQITIAKHLINAPEFLLEGMECQVLFHADEERPMVCELPQKVTVEVTYTEPGIKGDTATNTLKPATVETGAEVRVPLFINQGDKIVVDSASGDYKERAKE